LQKDNYRWETKNKWQLEEVGDEINLAAY